MPRRLSGPVADAREVGVVGTRDRTTELLTWREASVKHFVRMQIFHRPEPRSILWPELRLSVSQSVGLGGWHDRAGSGPGSGLGASSETGADRVFRIVKSETMKRVDHKR